MVNVPPQMPSNVAANAYSAGATGASGAPNQAPVGAGFSIDSVRPVERRDPQFGGNKAGNRQQQPERFQEFYSSEAADYEAGSPRGSYLNIVV